MSGRWHEVHAHLIGQTARARFHRAFQQLRQRHSAVSDFPEAATLIEFMHRGTDAKEQKNTVLRALVGDAQAQGGTCDTGAILVLLALWPGLDAIRRRLLRYFRKDPDLLTAELTGRMFRAVATADLGRVNRIAATFLRNIERDIRRELIQETNKPEHFSIDDGPEPATWPAPAPANLREGLRSIVGADADLVMAVAIFGFSQREAARALGLTYEAARKRYQRAMARLEARLDREGG